MTQQTKSLKRPEKRFLDLDADKLRGGYYTSSHIAQGLCNWGIRSKNDRVLEPSCGDGSFLLAAAAKFGKLSVSPQLIAKQLHGVEILSTEASKAARNLKEVLNVPTGRTVKTADFFDNWKSLKRKEFDCVVGNPPFIRYQSFPEPSRTSAMEIMRHAGLRPNRLTNIWVPFVVAACDCLREGGRLALVLPAELLQVTYASQLRSYLADHFRSLDIVTCNEMFFEKAEQEVILLLADGYSSAPNTTTACRVTLTEAPTAKAVVATSARVFVSDSEPKQVCHDSEKWLKYFLSAKEIAFMREVRSSPKVVPLSHHASVEVGVVTGKNKFFVVSEEEVDEHGLSEYVIPLIGRSAQLRGAKLTKREWTTLSRNGDRVHLFTPDPNLNGSLSAKAKRYILSGESEGYHQGYKCSIRTPWYSVPSLWVPGCFLFRQIYDFPRIVLNRAKATSTDTIHRVRCKSKPELVAACMYNHLSGASAEIEGRSYGGGVLELEPNEAELVLVPRDPSNALPISECDSMVRQGRLKDILLENDRLLLQEAMGLSKKDCKTARQIWDKMRNRRLSRRKTRANSR